MRRIVLFNLIFVQCFVCILYANEPNDITTGISKPNQVILITGASRGIGFESAKKLAEHGHHVYAGMRSPQTLDQKQEDLPATFYPIELDITQEESINNAFKVIEKQEGRLDVLINNAGCAVFGPLETIDIDQAKAVFEVNFFGTMRLMQKALPMMRKQNEGLIINLSSTSGVRPSPGWDIYGASKFALEGLSEAAAAIARQWNIDVVIIEPGTTATEFMAKSTTVGSRLNSETLIYEQFVPYALEWMQKRLESGQDPKEVAEVVVSIVENPQRQFRYQTSIKGKETVAGKHCDPSGDKSIREQELLVKQLWQSPAEAQSGG